MRTKIIASIAVVGTVAAIAALIGTQSSQFTGGHRLLQADPKLSDHDVKAFQTFVQKHNRNYMTKEEYNARLHIFASNLEVIRQNDPTKTGYTLGVNKFADLSLSEFEKMMGFNEPTEEDKFLQEPDEDQEFTEIEDDVKGRGL